MTTKGAPSPIRTYVSSVPATGTVPVRVATSAIAWSITWHPRTSVRELRHLYAERGSPKFEPAARRWLVRYLIEGTPGLDDVAKVGGREYREAGPRLDSPTARFAAFLGALASTNPRRVRAFGLRKNDDAKRLGDRDLELIAYLEEHPEGSRLLGGTRQTTQARREANPVWEATVRDPPNGWRDTRIDGEVGSV
jgi:hypothetical protein